MRTKELSPNDARSSGKPRPARRFERGNAIRTNGVATRDIPKKLSHRGALVIAPDYDESITLLFVEVPAAGKVTPFLLEASRNEVRRGPVNPTACESDDVTLEPIYCTSMS